MLYQTEFPVFFLGVSVGVVTYCKSKGFNPALCALENLALPNFCYSLKYTLLQTERIANKNDCLLRNSFFIQRTFNSDYKESFDFAYKGLDDSAL